ncbi:MAG: signal transduction histidine kinase, nitrogen specific, NtrB [Bacteroidetes bacterium]|jgi:PAS domain S-box-containing protein|nr:signal transduction histidine kinase, nitrogen specific, NtrB [Bacteroidota bacterium]
MEQKENIRVLLVEDDPDDYVLFKYSLGEIKDNSYTLTWASNFDEGLNIIRRNEHDIYFFDYLLGARTGLELIQESVAAGIHEPIIILTGLGNQQTDRKAMELGAADYLVKGEIDTEKLERSIRYCIDQNRMLKKLKASETKFRSIFENSHDVIYLTSKDGKILDVNKAAEHLFGYTREEMLKLDAGQLYENKSDREKFIHEINITGSCVNFEVVLLDKDNNRKFCTLTANIQRTPEGGEVYQGIIHDMTQRKKAEQDLIVAEKFAFIGKIARTLAHEVRNPLTNINLSVEQLEELLNEENYTIYLDIIKRNSKRINDLVTELLENSKPMELNKAAIPIQSILQSTVALARDRADLKNIQLITDFRLNNENIIGDESKLSIAFLNIIINAIEAVKKNTGVIRVESSCDSGKCLISIEDNGCGISQEHINRIFDPYFTSKPNGMGLGLSATQNIIHTHKGTIDIQSEINHGTKFIIELELAREQASA